jgi:TetR/AcrR family transcriptional regulator
MIYYYFGGKERLFVAVLERAYAQIRDVEQSVDVEGLAPTAAIRRLAELTYDHHTGNPDFIRLVSIENIHRGANLAQSDHLSTMANPVLALISTILDAGRAAGVFREDADPLDVHMLISSFCVFPVANRYTFETLFARDLLDPARLEGYRAMIGDVVVRYLTTLDMSLKPLA